MDSGSKACRNDEVVACLFHGELSHLDAQNFSILPEPSNSESPPAKPEVYPVNYEKILCRKGL